MSQLCRDLDCVDFAGDPDRVLHLLAFRLTPRDRQHQGVTSVYLPDRLAEVLPGNPPRLGWKHVTDTTGRKSWYHTGTTHSLWTYDTAWDDNRSPMQLPWQLFLEDIVQLGGGIFHGGLAVLENRGYLFTAPPGGGKTTALSRMPSSWKIFSDDAALIWPMENDLFRASPLPTWSVLLGRSESPPRIGRWRVADSFKLVRVILLKKASQDRVSPISSFEAIQHLYRALCEHPRVVSNRDPFRKQLFHAACDLARAVSSWELELTRAGNFWNLLEDDVSDAR